MTLKEIFWCGEGDLFSRSPLKTSKLYITQTAQNATSARSTPPSHTTSHTGLQRQLLRGPILFGDNQFGDCDS
jgi:hypothetical protein